MTSQTKTEETVPVVEASKAVVPTETETAASPVASPKAELITDPVTPIGSDATPETHLLPPNVWAQLAVPEGDDDSAFEDTASSTESVRSSILKYRTLHGRTYQSQGEKNYWVPNDDRQNNTLDIGHHTYTLLMGNKLYLAPLPEKMDKAIDIGTGTGVWAIDFADDHPDTQVIGTDISPIQPLWVPPNVSFQIDDFSEPWTFEENSADYIHFRWLCGAVQDWTALFKKAYNVLKPGGYIESFDLDGNITSDDGTVTNKTAISQWGYIFQEGANNLGLNVSFNPVKEGLQLKALVDAGFVNIVEKPIKLPTSEWPEDPLLREVGQYTRIALANDVEGFVGMMATTLGWSQEEIAVYAAHVRRELQSLKVHAYIGGCIAYAQKPLEA